MSIYRVIKWVVLVFIVAMAQPIAEDIYSYNKDMLVSGTLRRNAYTVFNDYEIYAELYLLTSWIYIYTTSMKGYFSRFFFTKAGAPFSPLVILLFAPRAMSEIFAGAVSVIFDLDQKSEPIFNSIWPNIVMLLFTIFAPWSLGNGIKKILEVIEQKGAP